MAENFSSTAEALAPRGRIVATVDPEIERARKAAEVIGDAKPYASVEEAFDSVDAVMLILPHHVHHSVAMQCLEAGKHVFLEKPMANTEQQCLDLIRASEASGQVFMIGYVMRYHPLVQKLKELLDTQEFGEVFEISIWTEQYTYVPPERWSSSAERMGGGQLFSHGCHYIDLMLWFLGRPIKGVHMGTKLGTPWMDWEGTSHVTMEFEGGALGYHGGTWGARGTRLRYSMHAHCTEAMLEVDIKKGQLIAHRTKGVEKAPSQTSTRHEEMFLEGTEHLLLEAPPQKPVTFEMQHFLDCIEQGKPPLTNARDSLQGLRVIWRLYEAERAGKVADLQGLGFDENPGQ
jgi:predicted dehydrogenase